MAFYENLIIWIHQKWCRIKCILKKRIILHENIWMDTWYYYLQTQISTIMVHNMVYKNTLPWHTTTILVNHDISWKNDNKYMVQRACHKTYTLRLQLNMDMQHKWLVIFYMVFLMFSFVWNSKWCNHAKQRHQLWVTSFLLNLSAYKSHSRYISNIHIT